MHIAVAWDINNTNQWAELNEQLKSVLMPYSWARPLNTFYVVKVNDESVRRQIITRLQEIAVQHPTNIRIIVTPLMSSGFYYDGYVPKEMWDHVNERSK